MIQDKSQKTVAIELIGQRLEHMEMPHLVNITRRSEGPVGILGYESQELPVSLFRLVELILGAR
jgi:hypothetical protein